MVVCDHPLAAKAGVEAKSYLGVPIMIGSEAIGVISVQSIHEEGRFGEADAGLLATIAASVGVAIQNARLFEAQRDAERRYRQLVEELPLAVYTDTPDVTMTSEYMSPRVEEMLGYPREAWSDGSLSRDEVDHLEHLRSELRISSDQHQSIEKKIRKES